MVTFSSKERAIFYEKLAQLYKAGVPISEGLPLATMQVQDQKVRRGLERVQQYLQRGRTLTEGFSQSPEIFSDMEIAIIHIGEEQGRLDQSLLNLSAWQERKYKDIKTFIFAMLYPTFLLFAAIFIPPIISLVNEGLNAYIKAVVGSLLTIAIPIATLALLYYGIKKNAPELFDRFVLGVPILGKNLRKMAFARFSRSLATLFASGVELRRSIKLAISSLSNRYLERRCRAIERALDEGRTITEGLQLSQVFDANLVETVAIGERAGELDQMLNKLAEYYEFEAEKAFKALLTMLPICLYLCVAAYIGYIVISFYANYFNTIGNIVK